MVQLAKVQFRILPGAINSHQLNFLAGQLEAIADGLRREVYHKTGVVFIDYQEEKAKAKQRHAGEAICGVLDPNGMPCMHPVRTLSKPVHAPVRPKRMVREDPDNWGSSWC